MEVPPSSPQRLAADDGEALVLLLPPLTAQSTPRPAAGAKGGGAGPPIVLVWLMRVLADDVTSCRLGAGQEAEGGRQGAEAVDGYGVTREAVGATRGGKRRLRGVTGERGGQGVWLGGGLG